MHAVGDSPNLSQLIDKQQEFLNFLIPRVSNSQDAEDLLQTAYLKGLEADLDELESPVAWFYRVLRNSVVDTYRRRDSTRRGLELFGADPAVGPTTQKEIETLACQCVESLLETLHPGYAEILAAVDLGGTSITEFGERHRIEPNNVRVRLHRARQAMRQALLRTCGLCAEHGCLDCDCS